jgi:hypothetical protein
VQDTYAEALFANHRVAEAVSAARKALELARDRQNYYQNQVRRFQRHLER